MSPMRFADDVCSTIIIGACNMGVKMISQITTQIMLQTVLEACPKMSPIRSFRAFHANMTLSGFNMSATLDLKSFPKSGIRLVFDNVYCGC